LCDDEKRHVTFGLALWRLTQRSISSKFVSS
jgi:hypothetical protein